MKAEPKEFCASAYILDRKRRDGTRPRVIVDGTPVKIGMTIMAENKKQAQRIIDEIEFPGHEFIEWW